MMDERILKVMQEVARGDLVTHAYDNDDCLFCGAEEMRSDITELEDVKHEPDCPVAIARQVLQDMGTPPYIYKVEYEYRFIKSKEGDKWKACTHYTIACDEASAINSGAWMRTSRRNARATVVRMLPLDEVK